MAFYGHFVRQTRGLFVAMFVTGLGVALIDLLIPVFIGKLVGLMAAEDRAAAFAMQAPLLIAIALAVLIGRPLMFALDSMVRNNAVIPGVTTLVRWQSHWHVIRQPWSFFQNDFAGRIANRVMNTANSLRESVVSSIRAVWYIVVYGSATLLILLSTDVRLAIPMALWIAGYLAFLWYFVPRMRDLSRISSEARSQVMGRVVDSYSNFPTVKLFARAADEDAYVREAMVEHRGKIAAHMRMTTLFMGTAAIGLALWLNGQVSAALVATALPLAWQIANMAGWVSWEVSSIFENIGVVQEGMETIAVPHALVDAPDAQPLTVPRGAISFDRVHFGYGQLARGGRAVLDDLTLTVAPGDAWAWWAAPAPARARWSACCCAFTTLKAAPFASTGRTCAASRRKACAAPSAWSRRTPRCCTGRSPPTCATAARRRATRRSKPPRAAPMRTSSSSRCATGRTAPATPRMPASAA
jgi:ATP-binding cassette subfamily B multidrug efflux pump